MCYFYLICWSVLQVDRKVDQDVKQIAKIAEEGCYTKDSSDCEKWK